MPNPLQAPAEAATRGIEQIAGQRVALGRVEHERRQGGAAVVDEGKGRRLAWRRPRAVSAWAKSSSRVGRRGPLPLKPPVVAH